MIQLSPRMMILLGFVLVLAGVVLPVLMVIRLLEPTFFLTFFSYGASVVGLFLGIIGTSRYVRWRDFQKKRDYDFFDRDHRD